MKLLIIEIEDIGYVLKPHENMKLSEQVQLIFEAINSGKQISDFWYQSIEEIIEYQIGILKYITNAEITLTNGIVSVYCVEREGVKSFLLERNLIPN